MLTDAQNFFFRNAGYSWDPRTETRYEGHERCALRLAQAEAMADELGWYLVWEDDPEASFDEGAQRYIASVRTSEGTLLQNLGGVDDCSHRYGRVLFAELALAELVEMQVLK